MSEERFERIEHTLTTVVSGQEELRREVGFLRTDVDELKTDVRVLKTDVQVLKTDGQVLKTDVFGLRGEVDGLRRDVHEFRHEMLVLHEHTMDAIKALAPDWVPIRREFTAADAQLRDEVDLRLVPLEAIARRGRARKSR